MEIPQFGFGVFQVPPEETAETVRAAFDAGYRHIDTAQMYGNEEGVGRALAESGLSRDEVFVTTKLNNDGHGYDAAIRAARREPAAAGHRPRRPVPDPLAAAAGGPLRRDVAGAFEKALAEGKTRSIGVSNFTVAHLERLAKETDTVPAVNQVELHPRFAQPELRAYHAEHGIATEAWSPIGAGRRLLDDPVLVRPRREVRQDARRRSCCAGTCSSATSSSRSRCSPERMRENIDVFDFELADDDMQAISALDRGTAGRLGPNPDTFG